MRKKNYGQKPLPNLESQLEAEAVENEQPPSGMPSLAMIKSEVVRIGLLESDGEEIYDFWLANGFRLKAGTGAKVSSWKAVIRSWYRNGFFPSQKEAKKKMEKLAADQARQKAGFKRLKGGR